MAKKTVKISVDTKARIEYPRATVAANIVPAMRTPDNSFPLAVHVVQQDENGLLAFDESGKPIIVKTILQRVKPKNKETMCGLKSPYHVTWAYSLAHSIVAYFQGANVKGRVYSVTFALNYARPELDMAKLFDSGFLLLVEMPASKSNPATFNGQNSTWTVTVGALRDYALAIAAMTTLADEHTEQRIVESVSDESEPVIETFEL